MGIACANGISGDNADVPHTYGGAAISISRGCTPTCTGSGLTSREGDIFNAALHRRRVRQSLGVVGDRWSTARIGFGGARWNHGLAYRRFMLAAAMTGDKWMPVLFLTLGTVDGCMLRFRGDLPGCGKKYAGTGGTMNMAGRWVHFFIVAFGYWYLLRKLQCDLFPMADIVVLSVVLRAMINRAVSGRDSRDKRLAGLVKTGASFFIAPPAGRLGKEKETPVFISVRVGWRGCRGGYFP